MTAEQQAIFDDVMATRGSASGPFLAWLQSPELADRAQKLGAFCRFGTSLSLVESELLILHVAAHFHCTAEQQIHEPIARKAGLPDAVITDIRAQRLPALTDERQLILADYARELLRANRVGDALHERAVLLLGEPALVEAVGIVGYYAMVAYTLNAFEMKP